MTRKILIALLALILQSPANAAASYDGLRWFQIEVSIFTNEFPALSAAENLAPERLKLAYPETIRGFREIFDFLAVEQLQDKLTPTALAIGDPLENQDEPNLLISKVGPFPEREPGNLKLPDIEREAYLLLPPSLSDFQTTNSRLENSPNNRLLFHGLWRQPVQQLPRASALKITGGNQYGRRHELEGSLTIRFNAAEDRVVIDTDLWFSEFTSGSVNQQWQLPVAEDLIADDNALSPNGQYNIRRISQMKQSRDMRSTEFHYLDHPAIGLVITVIPYDLPPPASAFYLEPQSDAEASLEDTVADPI